MMIKYHTTNQDYQIRHIVSIKKFDGNGLSHYHNNLGDKQWVNDFLDKRKPADMPERKSAIYTFDSIANCLEFEKSLKHIYKVEIPDTIGHPMCLVNCLLNPSNNSSEKDEIAKEYWEPKNDWKFKEYLCKKMTILEECNDSTASSGLMDYLNDWDKAKKIFSSRNPPLGCTMNIKNIVTLLATAVHMSGLYMKFIKYLNVILKEAQNIMNKMTDSTDKFLDNDTQKG